MLTTRKHKKARVRSRMAKTGESYVAALGSMSDQTTADHEVSARDDSGVSTGLVARVVTYEMPPEEDFWARSAESRRQFEGSVLPRLRKLKGFRAGFMLLDAERREGINILLWSDRDSLAAAMSRPDTP